MDMAPGANPGPPAGPPGPNGNTGTAPGGTRLLSVDELVSGRAKGAVGCSSTTGSGCCCCCWRRSLSSLLTSRTLFLDLRSSSDLSL